MFVKNISMNKFMPGKRSIAAMLVIFAVGIGIGAVVAMSLPEETNSQLGEYLTNFMSAARENSDKNKILKNSLLNNLRIFSILFFSSFFRIGVLGTGLCVGVKGFASGFTTAELLKSYGTEGLLINLCALPPTLLFVPSMIIYAAYSAGTAIAVGRRETRRRRSFVCVSAAVIAVFCVSAFLESCLTTTFMKYALSKII